MDKWAKKHINININIWYAQKLCKPSKDIRLNDLMMAMREYYLEKSPFSVKEYAEKKQQIVCQKQQQSTQASQTHTHDRSVWMLKVIIRTFIRFVVRFPLLFYVTFLCYFITIIVHLNIHIVHKSHDEEAERNLRKCLTIYYMYIKTHPSIQLEFKLNLLLFYTITAGTTEKNFSRT